jgi:plastocyanin
MAAPTLKTVASSEPRLTAKPVSQVVRAAGSAGVSMRNFAFSPSSVRVNVGDSVTWTNQDPAPHNAKGSGVSTPTIKKGQSASQTFSKAGTFSYICTIHPSMHGTVVVAGAASSGGSSGGGSDSSGDSSPSTDSGTPATGSGLPQTGLAIGSVVLVALMLLGSGELLRRLLPERE